MSRTGIIFAVIIFVCLFGVNAFSAGPTTQPSPTTQSGGVCFLDKGQIVYFDIVTGKITNLTDKNTAAKEPFSISADGKMLIWFEKNNLVGKKLLRGEKFSVFISYPDEIIERDSFVATMGCLSPGNPPTPSKAKNLVLLPSGSFLSIEAKKSGWSYIRNVKNPTGMHGGKSVPRYTMVMDGFDAIFLVGIGAEKNKFPAGKLYWIFGNTIQWRETPRLQMYPPGDPFQGERYEEDKNLTPPQSQKDRLSAARSAYFFAWGPTENKSFAYVLHQIKKPYLKSAGAQADDGKAWGPLVICSVDRNRSFPLGGYEQEISIGFKNCTGLAWKPDQSLTVLADGKMFYFEGEQLTKSLKENPPDKAVIIKLTPSIIIENIEGTRPFWVSSDMMIFRAKDGSLSSWSKNGVKKILDFIPELFYWCATPPAE